MSDSTTKLDTISASQSQKEVTQNALNDALSQAAVFGRRASTTSGLIWGYYGGRLPISGYPADVPSGTLTLTNNATNYVYATPEVSPTGWHVTVTTSIPSSWPGPLASDAVALYQIVTSSGTVSSYTDLRVPGLGLGTTGSGTTPGGSDGYVQYNNGGVFGGDSRLAFDDSTKILTGQFAIDSNAINAQTGTTYTILASDNGKVITLSNSSAITVSVPTGLAVGFSCVCIQIGAGQVTFAPAAGSPQPTINPSTKLKIAAQHGAASLIHYTSNIFNLSGNTSA